MEYGARNKAEGKIVEIKKGTLMCQVSVKVPAEIVLTSVMTLDSLAELGVHEGDKVKVITKAVNVLLAKE